MKIFRKIVEIDENRCNGCGNCVLSCQEGAIEIINHKARVVSDIYCDGLGACLKDCPFGALKIVERQAAPFDQQAAAEHLDHLKETGGALKETLPCGCPSTMQQTLFNLPDQISSPNIPVSQKSSLINWPVQIRLISSEAPFLKNAHLLIAADCTAFSCPDLHQHFIKGRVVLSGCPKFDPLDEYKRKFTEIFKSCDIKTITVLIMEVPCCSQLPKTVTEALRDANVQVPVETVTLTLQGQVKQRDKYAA